ncbi:MAG TPA: hypothetical protein PKM48_11935, partial [Parvularculaceae bacterium]|nr:hypothetical protein [Parvularculaceae bacterium]
MRLILAAVAFAFSLIAVAPAQDAADRAREKDIASAAATLSALARDLREDGVDDPNEFERAVRSIARASRERLSPVEEAIGRTQDSLDLLGPAP